MFHPIERVVIPKIAEKVQEALPDEFKTWVKGWLDAIKNGIQKPLLQDGETVQDPEITADADAIVADGEGTNDQLPPSSETVDASGSETENGISTEKAIGAVSAAGAIALCTLSSLDNNVGKLRVQKVAYPLMREAGTIIGLGSEIQNGQALDATQVGYFSKLLNGPSLQQNSQASTTWFQAKSIQAESGNPNYASFIKPSTTLQNLNQNSPFHFLNTGIIGTALNGKVGYVYSGSDCRCNSQHRPLHSEFDRRPVWICSAPL